MNTTIEQRAQDRSDLREYELAMSLKVFVGEAMTTAERLHLSWLRSRVKAHEETNQERILQ